MSRFFCSSDNEGREAASAFGLKSRLQPIDTSFTLKLAFRARKDEMSFAVSAHNGGMLGLPEMLK